MKNIQELENLLIPEQKSLSTNVKCFTGDQKDKLLAAMYKAEKMLSGESKVEFGEYFITESIAEFQRLGFTFERALYLIGTVHRKKTFGSIKFSDFIDQENDLIDYEEVDRLAERKAKGMMKDYLAEQEKIKQLSIEAEKKESEATDIISNQSKLQEHDKAIKEKILKQVLLIFDNERNPMLQRNLIKKIL